MSDGTAKKATQCYGTKYRCTGWFLKLFSKAVSWSITYVASYKIILIVRNRYFEQSQITAFGEKFFTKPINVHPISKPFFVATLLDKTEKRRIYICILENFLQGPKFSTVIQTGQPGTVPFDTTQNERIGNSFLKDILVHQSNALRVQSTLVCAQEFSKGHRRYATLSLEKRWDNTSNIRNWYGYLNRTVARIIFCRRNFFWTVES